MRDGKIVGEGANSVTATNDPTAHAEVNAIRAAAKALGTFTLAGCELYTSCEPCPMCLAAAYWARLDAVYYGASAADAARAGFDDAFLYAELRKDTEPAQTPLNAVARRRSVGQLCRMDRLAEQDRILRVLMSSAATTEIPAPHIGSKPLLVRRAAVLGAGTMGSRIAAHLANAGIPVLLLGSPAKK